jgi:hypothetical protein
VYGIPHSGKKNTLFFKILNVVQVISEGGPPEKSICTTLGGTNTFFFSDETSYFRNVDV